MILNLLLVCFSLALAGPVPAVPRTRPLGDLQGLTIKFTVIRSPGMYNMVGIDDDCNWNKSKDSGYIPQMMKDVARLANGKFEVALPSGKGSNCNPPYDSEVLVGKNCPWQDQYNCGQDDSLQADLAILNTADGYWGAYFATTIRLDLGSRFTEPYTPPSDGLTMFMFGASKNVDTFDDLVTNNLRACVGANTAYATWLSVAFPMLKLVEVENGIPGFVQGLRQGLCEVGINTNFFAKMFVRESCGEGGGIVGEPLDFGLTNMIVGLGQYVSQETIQDLSYWILWLGTCIPDSEGLCHRTDRNMTATSLSFSYNKWIGEDPCTSTSTSTNNRPRSSASVLLFVLVTMSLVFSV